MRTSVPTNASSAPNNKPQADLPLDVTKQALLASAATPAARLSCQSRLTIRLTAQLSNLQQQQPAGHGGNAREGGYVLGCRMVRPRSMQEVKAMLRRPPSLKQGVQALQEKVRTRVVPADWLCAGGGA